MVCSVFFNDTATTEIYTLSLHDALPISAGAAGADDEHASALRAAAAERDGPQGEARAGDEDGAQERVNRDRKSTRLNSSHANISYAVFCLKKKIIFPITSPHSNYPPTPL